MHLRISVFTLLALVFVTVSAMAQQYPANNGGYPPASGGNVQQNQPAQPDQPVNPQLPTIERRDGQPVAQQPTGQQPAQPQPPAPPFVLTPQEQAEVDRVLALWEQRNRDVKTFDCHYKRWTYDAVFGRADVPKFVDLGVIKYAAPDRGMFRTDTTEKDGREVPIEDNRAEHWISDGKSIIEYNHVKKEMIVHKLPPELQGKAIADSPLPFLFGSEAKKLKQRYFIRLITPQDVKDQIWLEVYPRFQQNAANFHHAQFIITTQGMQPNALKLIQPNKKDCMVYSFYNIVMNDPLRMFRGDPFRATKPLGWKATIDDPAGAQAQRGSNDGRR